MGPALTGVQILRIAAGGDGVGRLSDGRTVFVPRTAPGDLVELRDIQLHARFARARVDRLLAPSPERIEPRCPHYRAEACGGCQLQHLNAAAQRETRRAILGDALRRLGHLDIPDPPIEPAEQEWGYRAKLTLAARDRRIGLHRWDRPEQIFDLVHCEITAPALMRLWSGVRAHRSRLPRDLSRLLLRLDRSGGCHIILEVSGAPRPTDAKGLYSGLAERGLDVTIWCQPEGGAPRVVAGDEEAFPAVVFEQVNPAMGDRVRAHAVVQLGEVRGKLAWDLYAGIGETTERLLALGASVESVELDRRAVQVAERRGREAAGVPESSQRPSDVPVVRHVGRAEDLVSRLRPPDLIVTNPPRSGMEPAVVRAIRDAPADRLVYVSCDPATLARDLSALLASGERPWRLADIRAFDLFPQTSHVEAVALLERT